MMSRRALFSWILPGGEEPEAPFPPSPARGRVAWLADRRAEVAEVAEDAGPRVVVVSPFACLNAGADFCATCVERCPAPGAIRIEGRRVVVAPDRCDGCGRCVPYCPAPGGALRLQPAVL
jgi:NAD-dependent dihydropyrimidine dehydrogenase PreA subunit